MTFFCQHDRQITTKASKVDLVQFQNRMQDTASTKDEVPIKLLLFKENMKRLF